jgi:two-component system, chemotaxis family, chemotaxis protein CheY
MAKILVVDDSSLMRLVLKNFITKEGHEVIEAIEGNEAIRKFKSEKPAMVFLDILMPNGLDGISALKEIKKYDSDAKVVMVTSVKEQKEFEEAKKLGVKGYLNKPFSREEITKALKENL